MFPKDWRITLDPSVRRIDGGSVLVGGSPLRIMRLTDAGARLIDKLAEGTPLPQSSNAQRLLRRLLDAGMAHPRPGRTALRRGDVTLVIALRDQTLARKEADGCTMVVVDDGSEEPPVVHAGTTVLRHDRAQGPAAARNTGWRAATTDLIAFVDADCAPNRGWLEQLLPHFDDPMVAAVAPRITSTVPGILPRALASYEASRPALDRGGQAATVRPRSPVPFVPTAALVVRRRILQDLGGFDETMRFGEDVDLIWRVTSAGWTVRYEPSATVAHPARSTASAWLRQRFDYGTSAAPLARKHGTAVAPLAVSPWSALVWGLAGMGAPVAGAAVAFGTTAVLARRLRELEHPWAESLQLAGKGHLYAGRSVADAVRRAWWPLALGAAVVSKRARRGLIAAAMLPSLLEWWQLRPNLDPATWTMVRVVDDMAYGAGVWAGCLHERSSAALRPDLTLWPGRHAAVEQVVSDLGA
jgi:mycofactocin system glycosyltransferase